jgi:hypothetical protein
MNYRDLPDEALLALYKDSDSDAYKEIYLRYWKQVYLVAYKKLHSKTSLWIFGKEGTVWL